LGEIYKQTIEVDCPEIMNNFAELQSQLPFVLQGCDTDEFHWDKVNNVRSLHFDHGALPFSHLGLLREILEPALLYKKLKDFMESSADREGLLRQALDSAVEAELHNYAKFVGVLEGEVRRQLLESDGLTLQKVLALLQEATQGLRLLYSIYGQSLDKQSGDLLTMLYSHSYNGDHFIATFASRLLDKVAMPFFEMLRQWMTSGDLMDPHYEFFVRRSERDELILDRAMIPVFVSSDVADHIYELGKALYFIRVECGDNEWIEQRRARGVTVQNDDSQTQQIPENLKHLDEAGVRGYWELQRNLELGYDEVLAHLNELLKSKFKLDVHLRALKDYLLLGNGDFAQTLLEEGSSVLSQPAASLYRHALTSMLENVIRASNARNESLDVLDSLDARMLKSGQQWDGRSSRSNTEFGGRLSKLFSTRLVLSSTCRFSIFCGAYAGLHLP
jgi:gamma-tubulin complex component 3